MLKYCQHGVINVQTFTASYESKDDAVRLIIQSASAIMPTSGIMVQILQTVPLRQRGRFTAECTLTIDHKHTRSAHRVLQVMATGTALDKPPIHLRLAVVLVIRNYCTNATSQGGPPKGPLLPGNAMPHCDIDTIGRSPQPHPCLNP